MHRALRYSVDPKALGCDEVFHYSIPALDEFGDGALQPTAEIGSDKLLLRGGELLVSKINPRITRVLMARPHSVPTIASTEFIALVPQAGTDPKFLTYWLRSETTRQFLDGATLSATRSQQRIRPDLLTKAWLTLPPERVQRAIADYLDVETARMDALTEKKLRMIELVAQRFSRFLTDKIFANHSVPWVRLSRLCKCLPGFAFASDDFSTDPNGNIRLLRGVNVVPGGIRWDDVVWLPPNQMGARESRYLLQEGDLVVGMDRPLVGDGLRVARIATEDLPALLVQRVARLRSNNLSTNEFLRYMLMSQAFANYFTPITTGVSVPHISEEQIVSFRVPMLTLNEQQAQVAFLEREEARARALVGRLEHQLDLLSEYRQSVITAAVSGQIAIPGVAV